jgi:cytochrome P450
MCAHIVGSVRKVMPAQGVRITTAAGRVCRVPAGDFCCISYIVPHRNAAVFPEPLAFKPDRHLPAQQQPASTTATTAGSTDSSSSGNATAAAGIDSTNEQSATAAAAAAVPAAGTVTQQQGCVPHAGLWHYSAGAHRCPGEHFAGLLMRTVVWTLASRYDMQVRIIICKAYTVVQASHNSSAIAAIAVLHRKRKLLHAVE